MDLNAAIETHSKWKSRFYAAIAKKEQMDASTISKDNCCELGKWLYSDAKMRYSHLPSYLECIKKHTTFHYEAGKVALTINAKKYAEAQAILQDSGTAFSIASREVGIAIMHLKKEASL